jgi:hypothetical protein
MLEYKNFRGQTQAQCPQQRTDRKEVYPSKKIQHSNESDGIYATIAYTTWTCLMCNIKEKKVVKRDL